VIDFKKMHGENMKLIKFVFWFLYNFYLIHFSIQEEFSQIFP